MLRLKTAPLWCTNVYESSPALVLVSRGIALWCVSTSSNRNYKGVDLVDKRKKNGGQHLELSERLDLCHELPMGTTPSPLSTLTLSPVGVGRGGPTGYLSPIDLSALAELSHIENKGLPLSPISCLRNPFCRRRPLRPPVSRPRNGEHDEP